MILLLGATGSGMTLLAQSLAGSDGDGVLEQVAHGLMALRQTTRRTVPVVACLPAVWEHIQDRAAASVADRTRHALNLFRAHHPGIEPTLVVAGKHDTVRPPAGTEDLSKKIPGAKFALIEEAGHFLPTTGPKTLVKLLKDFLPK